MRSHMMELPRLIVIGNKNIIDFGSFLKKLDNIKQVSLITGSHVKKKIQKEIECTLESSKIKYSWHSAQQNEISSIKIIEKDVKKDKSDMIIGIGGGRSVDIAKIVAFNLKKPLVSVPTSASHDGISSPFVSIKGDKPYSIVASSPNGVFVDINIIKKAPSRLLISGCGDLIANITAIKDWELSHKKTGEYYGRYAANLALMSANMVLENSNVFAKNGIDSRIVVEALISAGVASCIAGSSRPCSGSEHLFSHALDKIAPGVGLHGEKCGIGSIMMAKLHKQDWKKIAQTIKNIGAPITAKEIGLTKKNIIDALVMAQKMRPERYTILKERKMTEKSATELAESTRII